MFAPQTANKLYAVRQYYQSTRDLQGVRLKTLFYKNKKGGRLNLTALVGLSPLGIRLPLFPFQLPLLRQKPPSASAGSPHPGTEGVRPR